MTTNRELEEAAERWVKGIEIDLLRRRIMEACRHMIDWGNLSINRESVSNDPQAAASMLQKYASDMAEIPINVLEHILDNYSTWIEEEDTYGA